MCASPIPPESVCFGPFRFDADARKLCKHERKIDLSGQPLQILELLLRQPTQIVTREQLKAELWQGTTYVQFDAGLNSAIKKLRQALNDPAKNPRYIETVSKQGYRFIAPVIRCELSSSQGDSSVEEPVTSTSDSSQVTVSGDNGDLRPRFFGNRTKILALSATLIFLVAAVIKIVFVDSRARRPEAGSTFNQARVRPSIAVLGFKNLSGRTDERWISTLIADQLTADLGAGEKLRTIPEESIFRMKRDLVLSDAGSYARDTLSRVRDYLGADYVVVGAYFRSSRSTDAIQVDVRLQDAVTGETVALLTDKANEEELPDLLARTSAKLRSKLGIETISTEDSVLRTSLPSNPEASQLYSEGLIKLRSFDNQEAQNLLAKAAAADPQFPLVHSALADAWSALGYDEKAKEEISKAYRLTEKLSREDKLFVEARYFELNHNQEKAVDIYKTLFNFFPDNLEYGLLLANAQTAAGKGQEAIQTVASLKNFPLPSREDPRIDLAEAHAAKSLADYKHERAAAATAGAKATAQGARLEIAEAKLEEAGALDDLGQPDAAIELEGEAKAVFTTVGDYGGVTRALNQIGVALMHKGKLVPASGMYAESAAIAGKLGNKRGVATALNNMGIVRYRQGDLIGATKAFQEAANKFREAGDKENVAICLNNVAVNLIDLGNLADGRQKYEESLVISRETGDRMSVARTLNNLARLLIRLGDLDGARRRYEEALVMDHDGREHTYAVQGLADVSFWEGHLEEAHTKYQQALSSRIQIKDDELVAESRLLLAQVLLEEGDLKQAQQEAQQAADEFKKQDNGDDEAQSEAVLARALLRQGMTTRAREVINGAAAIAAKSEDRDARLSVAIETARIDAASGNTANAMKALRSAVDDAKKYHYFSQELEARLALAETEMIAGNAREGRAHLSTLATEARAKGFGLIANKAGIAQTRVNMTRASTPR